MPLRVDFFFFFLAEEVLTGEKSGECRVVLCSVIGVMKTARVG